jgi:hypothetical protein
MSPMRLSLRHLRAAGYLAEVVERRVPGANIRKDLFGFGDVIAIGRDVLIVQVTTAGNLSARVKKIGTSAALPILIAAGVQIVAHGWSKASGRWRLREVDVGREWRTRPALIAVEKAEALRP